MTLLQSHSGNAENSLDSQMENQQQNTIAKVFTFVVCQFLMQKCCRFVAGVVRVDKDFLTVIQKHCQVFTFPSPISENHDLLIIVRIYSTMS